MYGTLADLKEDLGIVDSSRDAKLTRELNTASEMIDNACGRGVNAFAAATSSATTRIIHTTQGAYYTREYDDVYYPGSIINVPPIGDATGLLVELGGPTTYATADPTTYVTGPDNAIVLGLPITQLRNLQTTWQLYPYVRVTARFGYPTQTPFSIQKAARLQAIRLMNRTNSPEGVIGSADWGGVRVARIDPDVAALLAAGGYALPGFA